MLPAPSVIVEWETGQEGHDERALACLAELNRQMWAERFAFERPPELILAFDPAATPAASVEAAARAAAGPRGWPGRSDIAAAPAGCDYYGKKNFGFGRSAGDVALFLDSDLAPEPGWLAAMVAPFADPAKNVVVGLTHFETGNLYERAMALFWIFEPREGEAQLRPTRRLVSNNIAFRRAVFAALPFPERPTYRGQCSELGGRLSRLGIVMHEATAGRAAHPAPAGAGAFARRAFHAGSDAAAYAALEGRAAAGGCAKEWRRDLGSVGARIASRSPAIGAGSIDRAAAWILGVLYYSIKAAGYFSESFKAPAAPRPRPARPGPLP